MSLTQSIIDFEYAIDKLNNQREVLLRCLDVLKKNYELEIKQLDENIVNLRGIINELKMQSKDYR